MPVAQPAVAANAVSALAVILAGVITLAFTYLLGPQRQPPRWQWAYACVFLTGLPTLWYHGFGEAFGARLADIGSNLLLAWALQAAVLGDYYTARTRRWVLVISGGLIAALVLAMLLLGPERYQHLYVPVGRGGGFSLGELLLIGNAVIAVGLLYTRRAAIPPRARPLLNLVTAVFAAGLYFASATNDQIDYGLVAYHAIWHTLAAFGFVALWGFNQARLYHGSALFTPPGPPLSK